MVSRIKHLAKLLAVSLAGFAFLAAAAGWFYRDVMEAEVRDWVTKKRDLAAQQAMRTNVKELPEVDAIDVLGLAGRPVSKGQARYQTDLSGPVYEAKKVHLAGTAASALAQLWRSQKVGPYGALCHEPHHALKFYRRGRLISEVSICFHCKNAGIPCGIFGQALVGFDPESPEYQEMKGQLEGLVGAAP